MGGGATESNIQPNAQYQQTAGNAYNQTNSFGNMPNYDLAANTAYDPNVWGAGIFDATNFTPQSLVDMGNTMFGQGGPLTSAGNQVMSNALDPNLQQYDFYQQQVNDATQAALAANGVMGPYGAGVIGQTDANFANQWALMESQKQDAALAAMSGAYGTAGSLEQAGAGTTAAAPALQQTSLMQFLQALQANYAQPEQALQNQYALMGQQNAQNQTSVQSAAQQNQAALLNSPFGFLGALFGGSGFGQGFGKAAGTALFAKGS